MKAAVLRQVGTPMAIEEVEIGAPEGSEVLLHTVATGLCHSDLHYIEGSWSTPLPVIPGHEASAIVEQVGPAVNDLEVGDHVLVYCSPACGRCRYCRTGSAHLCSSPPMRRAGGRPPRLTSDGAAVEALKGLGTFAEQMLVYDTSVVKIRKDMPLDKAALISCAVMTGFGSAAFTAKVGAGDVVAVIGTGGVGLNAIQGARFAGAQRVIAIDKLTSNLDLARQLGATDTIDASSVDAVESVLELTGDGVDYAIEAVGMTATAEQAFAMLRPGGTAIVIGMIPQGESVSVSGEALLGERRLQGSNMGSAKYQIHLPMLVDLYLDGRLELDDLLAKRIELAEINEGYEELARGRPARSVIVFDEAA
jgi:S-(hydroxymethyl)glutathione dehydrogenase / alcohol dehydrogenase